jgi:hypothetical protein
MPEACAGDPVGVAETAEGGVKGQIDLGQFGKPDLLKEEE